jgi:hypothetical protein
MAEVDVRLRIGQVVVQEAAHDWVGRAIAHYTNSRVSHAFLATIPGQGVEAWFPRVRHVRTRARLAELYHDDRAYVVLDLPGITADQRRRVAAAAEAYVGRWYDVGQVLLYAATRRFWNDGTGTLVCSRVVTGAFRQAGIDLFSPAVIRSRRPARAENLRRGWATPVDLLTSRLDVVDFRPSSRVRRIVDLIFPHNESVRAWERGA